MKRMNRTWAKLGICMMICSLLPLWGLQPAGAASLGEYSYDRMLPDAKVMTGSPKDIARDAAGHFDVLVYDDWNEKYTVDRHDAEGNYIRSTPLPDGYAADSVTADVYGNRFVTATKDGDGVVIKLDADDETTTFGQSCLNEPHGVAADVYGNIYVASHGDNSIVKFASDGDLLAKWTSYGGTNFDKPEDVTVAADGNLYVVDANAIVKLDPGGTYLDHLDMLVEVYDANHNYLYSFLHPPYSLTTDDSGNVYVAIQGSTHSPDIDGYNVLKYSLDDDSREGVIRHGGGYGESSMPEGMIYDNGKLYMADYNYQRLKVFNLSGDQLDEWYQVGTGSGQLYSAGSIAVDANGTVYVRDRGNYRVLIIPGTYPESGSIGTLNLLNGAVDDSELGVDDNGHVYLFGNLNNNGTVRKLRQVNGNDWEVIGLQQFSNLTIGGSGIDSDGTVYAMDSSNRIHQIIFSPDTNQDGMEETEEHVIIDLESFNYNGYMTGPAVDSSGNLYVLDMQNAKMLKLQSQGATYAIVDVWDDLSIDTAYAYPTNISVDKDGYVYIEDTSGWLRKFAADGQLVDAIVPPELLTTPAGFAIDRHNHVYLTENRLSRIFKFDYRSGRLKQLTVKSGSDELALSPAFDPGVTAYTLNVGHDVDALSVTAAAYDPDASIQLEGNGGTGASPYTASLQDGDNDLTVTVTAGGSVVNTYSLTITRASAPPNGGGGTPPGNNGTTGPGDDDETLPENREVSTINATANEDGHYVAEWKVPADSEGSGGANETEVIEIQSDLGNWQIPVDALKPPGEDFTLRVTIRQANDALNEQLLEQASNQGVEVVGTPIVFSTEWVAPNGNTQPFDTFAQYVTRSIEIEAGTGQVDPDTLVVLLYDPETGSFTPVPTQVRNEEGKMVVIFKRKGNSAYVVVQHGKTFDDIAQHWAKDAIEALASKYILAGKTDTTFDPNASMTRAEFAVMLTRALGLEPESVNSPPFPDVDPSDWYAPYVRTAADAELISGYEDETFAPKRNVTREEMAVIILRAMKFAGFEPVAGDDGYLQIFADSADISAWAGASVAALVREEIIQGRPNGLFAPHDDITRAEAAHLLYSVWRKIGFMN